MSLYPLYDEVLASLSGNETVLNQSHCTTIAKLSQEHTNIIYLLILHHYIIAKPGKVDFPYNSRTISNGKGISFRRLNQIPDDCQKIINRYLSMITTE